MARLESYTTINCPLERDKMSIDVCDGCDHFVRYDPYPEAVDCGYTQPPKRRHLK